MSNKKLIMLALAMTLTLMLSSCENTSTIGKIKGDSATESTVQEREAPDNSKIQKAFWGESIYGFCCVLSIASAMIRIQ